jgi:hypothetical protein
MRSFTIASGDSLHHFTNNARRTHFPISVVLHYESILNPPKKKNLALPIAFCSTFGSAATPISTLNATTTVRLERSH